MLQQGLQAWRAQRLLNWKTVPWIRVSHLLEKDGGKLKNFQGLLYPKRKYSSQIATILSPRDQDIKREREVEQIICHEKCLSYD